MKFRLRSAHYFPNDKLLLGDNETADKGEEKGTIVGDGTEWPMCALSAPVAGAMFPTIEMIALDEEAEEALAEEEGRLRANMAAMNPLDKLPMQMGAAASMDTFEERYVPGFNVKRENIGKAAK